MDFELMPFVQPAFIYLVAMDTPLDKWSTLVKAISDGEYDIDEFGRRCWFFEYESNLYQLDRTDFNGENEISIYPSEGFYQFDIVSLNESLLPSIGEILNAHESDGLKELIDKTRALI